jgi:UrcA family protein
MATKQHTISAGFASILLGIGGLIALQSAWARDTTSVGMFQETRVEAVRYDDIDISRDAGMRTLYARLNAAAKRVCGTYDRLNLRERRNWQQCYDSALSHAVAQVDDGRMIQWLAASDGRTTSAPRIGARAQP